MTSGRLRASALATALAASLTLAACGSTSHAAAHDDPTRTANPLDRGALTLCSDFVDMSYPDQNAVMSAVEKNAGVHEPSSELGNPLHSGVLEFCETGNNATSTVGEAPVILAAASPAPSHATPQTPDATSYTIPYTTGQGYKFEADVTVYPAVRGSDDTAMSQGWERVGGSGEIPCEDAVLPNSMSTVVGIHTDTAAYAFGTLTIKYLTTGFDAPDTMLQFTTQSGGAAAMGAGFSDGERCDGMTTGGLIFTPAWKSSTWGPVPVVFAFDGVFTPNHPDGDPEALTPVNYFLHQTYDAMGNKVAGIAFTLAGQ